MAHINIEIKASCEDPKKIRGILKSQGANFKGVDYQIDTYFRVPNGRLKLREGNIEQYLIYYERDDDEGPKQSNVILLPVPTNSTLKELLTKSLGVLVVVDKKRAIYYIGNVKFHIDKVKGLGSFVEIEAIDINGDIGRRKLMEQCQKYLGILGIKKNDLVAKSYSDMLL